MVETATAVHPANRNPYPVEQAVTSCSSSLKQRSVCMGCGEPILDQYILRVAPDLEWHAACLRCVDCHQQLDEKCTCFIKDHKTYCKDDYSRLFGAKCNKCELGFNRSDYVMRARNNIYHLDCFQCIACKRKLMPGEEFVLKDSRLYCKLDYDLCKSPCFMPVSSSELMSEPVSAVPMMTSLGCLAPPSPVQHTFLSPSIASGHLSSAVSPSDSMLETLCSAGAAGPSSSPKSQCDMRVLDNGRESGTSSSSADTNTTGKKKDKKDKPKTTRIRTVLNEKQLHTLRTCYNANPRPDALMKEQLVEMTSLSPRVIRVWFQNKRCKDKKRQIFMKHMQQQQDKNSALNGVRMQGLGPLIALSPQRHDMAMVQAMDVQQFQQNPAIWSTPLPPGPDNAESQTPFQQLMHGFGDPSNDPTRMFNLTGGSSFHSGNGSMESELDSFSPQMAGSELSSPSCSE